jgi:glycosyltransferase involved in cell wall biosynthesis
MPIVLDARTATDHFPGIGRYVVNLARALRQVAPDLDLRLLHDPSAAATRLALPDLPTIHCPVSPFSPRQQWVVPRHLRQVQATAYHSAYYLMPYLPGVPTVFTCYDLIPLIYPEHFTSAQRLIYRMAHLLAIRTARFTLAISQATKADLVRFFHADPQRIVVTPLAADPHLAPQSPERIAAVRDKYALPGQYALFLASNKPHKNLVRLIQAWQTSNHKSQITNLKLVIAGHWDPRYPEAKRLVEELDMKDLVIFAGPVAEADLPALYSGAMLFVFPSLYEGFGLPVIEAMACGAPVMCSATSSLPEAASDAALLIDPLDVDALAAALFRALTDAELRASLRDKGLAQAARLSWESTAQATLDVYRQVCTASAVRAGAGASESS